jgi:hypothetical protein
LWRSCGIERVDYGRKRRRRREDELNSKEMQSSRYTHTHCETIYSGGGGMWWSGWAGERIRKEEMA